MVVGQSLQIGSPATENCVAEQLVQARSLVVVQKPPEVGTEPAAHVALQLLQGCRPVELQVSEAVQGSAHVLVAVFHA